MFACESIKKKLRNGLAFRIVREVRKISGFPVGFWIKKNIYRTYAIGVIPVKTGIQGVKKRPNTGFPPTRE